MPSWQDLLLLDLTLSLAPVLAFTLGWWHGLAAHAPALPRARGDGAGLAIRSSLRVGGGCALPLLRLVALKVNEHDPPIACGTKRHLFLLHVVKHERPEMIMDGVTGPSVAKELTAKRIFFVRGAEPMAIHPEQLPTGVIAGAHPLFVRGSAV